MVSHQKTLWPMESIQLLQVDNWRIPYLTNQVWWSIIQLIGRLWKRNSASAVVTMQKGYRGIPKVIHSNNLYTELIISFYIVYCFLAGRWSHTEVRWLLNNSQMEQVASSPFLLFLWSLKYLLMGRRMENLKGVMRGFCTKW